MVDLPSGPARVAIHVGPVGLSHRGRDDVERRFQNPVRKVDDKDVPIPVESPPGATPILIGLWDEGDRPVLVGCDAERRIGRDTRVSLFSPLWLLKHASETGWSEHVSTSDELIVAFHPALLPVYLELVLKGAHVAPESIASVLDASGLVDVEAQPPEERARRAAMALVRSASFGRNVVKAYEGLCAMCGLNLGLCQGAHIYPASAPSSPDSVWNGVALCSNHHTAFDRHLVWVDAASRMVRFHPTVKDHARTNDASRLFIDSTLGKLREPSSSESRPRADMFSKRYEFFGECYDCAS